MLVLVLVLVVHWLQARPRCAGDTTMLLRWVRRRSILGDGLASGAEGYFEKVDLRSGSTEFWAGLFASTTPQHADLAVA